jgi:transposase
MRVGVDLAKRVIQVHAVDALGKVVTRRSLARDAFVAWYAQLPPGCLVVMEVSSSAHHWCRKLLALGLDARIVAAHLASPYRLREGYKDERNACINRIRGLLLEFGVAVPTGVRALKAQLDDVFEDATNELNGLARMGLRRAQLQWRQFDEHLAWCDERVDEHGRTNEAVQRASELMGVGPVGASASVATVGDFKQFKSGSQF